LTKKEVERNSQKKKKKKKRWNADFARYESRAPVVGNRGAPRTATYGGDAVTTRAVRRQDRGNGDRTMPGSCYTTRMRVHNVAVRQPKTPPTAAKRDKFLIEDRARDLVASGCSSPGPKLGLDYCDRPVVVLL
jgi:hypothetical protein